VQPVVATSQGGRSRQHTSEGVKKGLGDRWDGQLYASGNAPTTFEEVVEASGLLQGYPPVDHGASGHPFYTVQPMQLLSWHPRAYLFPKFINRDMCEHVIALAESRLAPSGLALKKGDTAASTREIRTSQGTFLSRGNDPDGVLAYIEDKIAVVTGIPAGHGEAFNILRYMNGQHYDSHFDSFDEESYGKQYSQRVRFPFRLRMNCCSIHCVA
jgi:prolyl 4-hydroxylase